VTIANEIGTPVYAIATDETAEWLSIDQSGLISRTPTEEDTIHVTVTVTDDIGPKTQEYDLMISYESVEITSTPVDTATKGVLYEYQLVYSGEGTFSVATDVAADWLTIDQNGLLSGTPTEEGSIHVTISLEGMGNTATQEFDLEVSRAVGFEVHAADHVKMYPNPASSVIFIENLPVNSRIDIYDITGKKVKTRHANASSIEIDLNNLQKGMYIFKVSTSENSMINRIVVE